MEVLKVGVLQTQEYKNTLWQNDDKLDHPDGAAHGNLIILRFTAESGKTYSDSYSGSFDIE